MTIAKHRSGALIDGDFGGGAHRLGVGAPFGFQSAMLMGLDVALSLVNAMSPVTTVTFSDLFLSSVRFADQAWHPAVPVLCHVRDHRLGDTPHR
jgi:hypothetical protein